MEQFVNAMLYGLNILSKIVVNFLKQFWASDFIENLVLELIISKSLKKPFRWQADKNLDQFLVSSVEIYNWTICV